jgi:ABC-type multidrug transport system permease subunit
VVMMNIIMEGVAPASSSQATVDPFIKVIVLGNTVNLPMIQLFTASTMVQFLLISGIIAAVMIVTQREDKTLMRVFSCPVSHGSIILGNLLGLSTVILIVAMIFIAITSMLLGISWGGSWLNIVIVTVFVIYAAASMGFLFSAIFRNVKLAGPIMSFVVMTMTFFSDSFTFSGQMDATARFTLNKWAYSAYNGLMEGRNLDAVYNNLLILGLSGTALLIIAILLYRRERIYE